LNTFLRLISRHRPVFILILLVTASLILLVTGTEAGIVHRGVQRMVSITAWPFLKAKNSIQDTVSGITDYVFRFEETARKKKELLEDAARMKVALGKLSELESENRRLREMLHFARAEARFTLEPVEVIESLHGMITIDRGRMHGIEASMCVITPRGVVGIVTDVGDFTARAATLHHRKCRIGAMVRRNRLRAYDGVVHGAQGDWQFICTMDYIDMKDEVRTGDRVVTSPESLFPAGYPIGTISSPPHGSGTLWKWAEVTPEVDPYRLDEVFLIRRAAPLFEAPAQPEPVFPGRAADANAPVQPDMRALQEKYAP
jgi:rod shape-determining protein MreC